MKKYSNYRHPKHNEVAARLRDGETVKDAAAHLGVNLRAAYRIRDIEGIAATSCVTTPEEKVARWSVTARDGEHTLWIGRTTVNGTPVIRQQGKAMQASHVVFRQRTGRDPVGICKSDCGVPHCLSPGHVLDEVERRTVRLQLRALTGAESPWDECPAAGHPWDVNGRVDPDGTLYCVACNRIRDYGRNNT